MNLANAKSNFLSSYTLDGVLRLAGKVLIALLIAVLVVVVIYPFIWLLLSSLKTRMEFRTSPMYAFPKSWWSP